MIALGYYLKAREVAAKLGVHVNTLKHIPASELNFVRLGRRGDRRYAAADVIAYMEERTERGNPLFFEGGEWWYWDETWAHRHGPFETKEAAKADCDRYAKELG